MKINRKGLLAGTFLAAGLAFSYSASAQTADQAVPDEVTPEMTAAWWQWVVSIPTSVHPLRTDPDTASGKIDPSSDYCMVGQHGDVWFLGGSFKQVDLSPEGNVQAATQARKMPSKADITRSCEVPLGMAILMPVLNGQCNAAEEIYLGNMPADWDYQRRVEYLRDECASGLADLIETETLKATFDPQRGKFSPLIIQRISTPEPFAITYAPDQILPGKDDEATGEPEDWQPDPHVNPSLAFADGYWVLVRPLSAGNYVLNTFGEVLPIPDILPDGFSLRVRYRLKVVDPKDQVGPIAQ